MYHIATHNIGLGYFMLIIFYKMDVFISKFGKSGSILEVRSQGEYQSPVT